MYSYLVACLSRGTSHHGYQLGFSAGYNWKWSFFSRIMMLHWYHQQMVMNLDKDNSINIIRWCLMSTFNAARSINIPRETNWEWLLLGLSNKEMLTTKIIFILLRNVDYLINEYLQSLKHPTFFFLKIISIFDLNNFTCKRQYQNHCHYVEFFWCSWNHKIGNK